MVNGDGNEQPYSSRQPSGAKGNQDGHCTDCGLPVWWQGDRLVNHDGTKWCYGKDQTRMTMERWHALPGMAQYVVPASEGQVCHCLAREKPHIHQIVEVPG